MNKYLPSKKMRWAVSLLFVSLIIFLAAFTAAPGTAVAEAGATSSVRVMKYSDDGVLIEEKAVRYEWMMENLPVFGDGVTHYYHQGPVFEGDMWDPGETVNLKDKGAVKGTSVRDLCDLVGGMPSAGEVVLRAVDGYALKLAYSNIYEPMDIQGEVALCWYKGEDAAATESPGSGYPGNNAFATALQIVIMAGTVNGEGRHVFGNTDMKISLPQEKYQHFYEGLPSTNGLSGKWIAELRIYPGGAPAVIQEESSAAVDSGSAGSGVDWLPIALGLAGLALIASSGVFLTRKRRARDGY